jgi:putative spermidine/putrescine transport system ATP-binding protein
MSDPRQSAVSGLADAVPRPVSAVTLDRVSFRYPGSAAGVQDVSLCIAPGELVVCIGPSGCGKTTLLRIIAGFLKPDSGSIRLKGNDVSTLPTRSRECGIVFQSYALFPHMRVWENVAYPLRVRGIALPDRRQRALAMLDQVGLGGFAERLPAQLSGGQQQRVALGRALVFEPHALLLDEPLSALDAATRMTMRDEVRRIQRQHNIASLLITHDQDEALSLADRVVVMRDGRIVQDAPPLTIYDTPADDFVANFVGRANLIDGTVAGPDAVDTPLGRLATRAHGRPAGTAVRLLVRPERIELMRAADGENVLAARAARDRFFGASRRVEAAVGTGRLEIETNARDTIEFVRIPRDAIQFLHHP